MKLYSYFRSSAAYRLRIALALKGLPYDYAAVNLLREEQRSEAYRALNPMGLVPALATEEGELLTQSVAILEWLEESYPEPPLLPAQPLARARVRAVVNTICCDIHPICNLSVTQYLQREFAAEKGQIIAWYTQWMQRGFAAIESSLASSHSAFCMGDVLSMADVCLVPQVYNARRFDIPLGDYPHIERVVAHCNSLDAFALAASERQPDSPQ